MAHECLTCPWVESQEAILERIKFTESKYLLFILDIFPKIMHSTKKLNYPKNLPITILILIIIVEIQIKSKLI